MSKKLKLSLGFTVQRGRGLNRYRMFRCNKRCNITTTTCAVDTKNVHEAKSLPRKETSFANGSTVKQHPFTYIVAKGVRKFW